MPDIVNPVILFDGRCPLCTGIVRLVLRLDRKRIFRFASLQSGPGRRLCSEYEVPDSVDTVILVDAHGAHQSSDAVLRIARRLPLGLLLSGPLSLLSRKNRNRIYAWIARNRQRWFGTTDICFFPGEDVQSRFLSE